MSDNAMQKTAQSAVLQVIARWCMIGVATIGVPLGGYVADRVIRNLDKISEKQDSTKDDINGLRLSMAEMKSANTMTNTRIDEIAKMNNNRLDAISAWTKRNADEIDKIKDWFYKPGGK